jgi:hypothetical protein
VWVGVGCKLHPLWRVWGGVGCGVWAASSVGCVGRCGGIQQGSQQRGGVSSQLGGLLWGEVKYHRVLLLSPQTPGPS